VCYIYEKINEGRAGVSSVAAMAMVAVAVAVVAGASSQEPGCIYITVAAAKPWFVWRAQMVLTWHRIIAL
jgi:hypothetical protein